MQESTKPLLRPNQVESYKAEAALQEHMLSLPGNIGGGIDRRQIVRHLRSLQHDLETQTPRIYPLDDLDAAVRRETQLREDIQQGMPTQAEMRRTPAGAVDKHMAWEKRNKTKLLEWKNIRLRLLESGQLGDKAHAQDAANFERFRPNGGAQELNMHNEKITGKEIHLPPPDAGPVTVMSDAQSETLKGVNPELHAKMAVLSNDQRAEVLALVDGLLDSEPRTPKQKAQYRPGWTPQRRKEWGEKMAVAREEAALKKARAREEQEAHDAEQARQAAEQGEK